eukprot:11193171-Lingulodinium_polyedra.AAC.1
MGSDGLGNWVEVKVGIPWSVEEFVHKACALKHPFDLQCRPGDRVLQCIFKILTEGPSKVAARRWRQLEKWEKRKEELQEEEDRIKARTDPEIAACLQGKRLLLLRDMLKEAKHEESG